MLKKLQRIDRVLAQCEKGLLTVFIAVMVVLAFSQVVMRAFGSGFLWGETLLKQMVLWTAFLGASLAANKEKHFAWEATQLGIPDKFKSPLRLLSALFAAVICVFLFWSSCRYAQSEYNSSSVLTMIGNVSIPSWVTALGIPIGFLLLSIHFLFKCFEATSDTITQWTSSLL